MTIFGRNFNTGVGFWQHNISNIAKKIACEKNLRRAKKKLRRIVSEKKTQRCLDQLLSNPIVFIQKLEPSLIYRYLPRRSGDTEIEKPIVVPDVKVNNSDESSVNLKNYPELVADAVGSPINTSISLKKNLKLGYSSSRSTCSHTQHELSQCIIVEENDDYEPLNTAINATIKEKFILNKISGYEKYKEHEEDNDENISDSLNEQPTIVDSLTDMETRIRTVKSHRISRVSNHEPEKNYQRSSMEEKRGRVAEKLKKKELKQRNRQIDNNSTVRNIKKQFSKDRKSGIDKKENDTHYTSPVKSPLRSPVKSPLRSPVRSSLRSPVRSSLRSPVRSSLRSPVRSSLRSPVRSPLRSPIRSPAKRKQRRESETEIPKKRKKHRSSSCSLLDETHSSKEYQKQKHDSRDIQQEEFDKSSLSSYSSKSQKYEKKSSYHKSNKHERRKKYDRSYTSSSSSPLSSSSSSLFSSSEETSPKNKLNVTDKHKKNSNDKNLEQRTKHKFDEAVSNRKKDNDKYSNKRRKQEKIFYQRSSVDSGIGCITPSREVPEDSEKEELDPEYNNYSNEKISKNSDRYSKRSKYSALSNTGLDKVDLKLLEKKRHALKEQIKLSNNDKDLTKKKLPSLPFISDNSSDEDNNPIENVDSAKDQVHSSDEMSENNTNPIIESEQQKQERLELAKKDAKKAIASIVDYSSSEESISSRMLPLQEGTSDTLNTSSTTNEINSNKNDHLDVAKDHQRQANVHQTKMDNHKVEVNDHVEANNRKTEVHNFKVEVNNHKMEVLNHINEIALQCREKINIKRLISQEESENKSTDKAVNHLRLSTKNLSTNEVLSSKSSHISQLTESDIPSMAQGEIKVLSAKQLWIEDVKNHPTFLAKLADLIIINNNYNNKGQDDFLDSTEFTQKIRVLNDEELGSKYKSTTPEPVHAESLKKAFVETSSINSRIVEPMKDPQVQEKEVNHEKSQDQSSNQSKTPSVAVDCLAEKKSTEKQNENNNSQQPLIYNNINIINMTCEAPRAVVSSASTAVISSTTTPTIINNSGTKVILTQGVLPISSPLHAEIQIPEPVSKLVAPKDQQFSTLSATDLQSQKLFESGSNSLQSFSTPGSNLGSSIPMQNPATQKVMPTASGLPITGSVVQDTFRLETGPVNLQTTSQSISYASKNAVQTQATRPFASQPVNSTNSNVPLVGGQFSSNQFPVSAPISHPPYPPPPYSQSCHATCTWEQCNQQNTSFNPTVRPQMYEQYNISHNRNITTVECLYNSIIRHIVHIRTKVEERTKYVNINQQQDQLTLFRTIHRIKIVLAETNRLKESLNLKNHDLMWEKIIEFSKNLNDEKLIINKDIIDYMLRLHETYQKSSNLLLRQQLERTNNPAQSTGTFQSSNAASEVMVPGQFGLIPGSSRDVASGPVPHPEINQNQQVYAQATKASPQQLHNPQMIMGQHPGMNQTQQAHAQPAKASPQQLNNPQMMMGQHPGMNQNRQVYAQATKASPQQLHNPQMIMGQHPGINQTQQAHAQPAKASPQQLNNPQMMMGQHPGINQTQQAHAQAMRASILQPNTSQMVVGQLPGMNQTQQAHAQPAKASPQQLNNPQMMIGQHPGINQTQQAHAQAMRASPQPLNSLQMMMAQYPGMNQTQQAHAQAMRASILQPNTPQMMVGQPPGINQTQQAYTQATRTLPQQPNSSQIIRGQNSVIHQNQQAQSMTFSQMASPVIQQPNFVQRPPVPPPLTNSHENQQLYPKIKIATPQQLNAIQVTPQVPVLSPEMVEHVSTQLTQIADISNKSFTLQAKSAAAPSQVYQHQQAYIQSRLSTQSATIPHQSNNIPGGPSPNVNQYQQASTRVRSSTYTAPPLQPSLNNSQATRETVPPIETMQYQQNYEQSISLSQMLTTPTLNVAQVMQAPMQPPENIQNQQTYSQYTLPMEMSSTSQQSRPVPSVTNQSLSSELLSSAISNFQQSHETGTNQSQPKKTRARKTTPRKKCAPQAPEKTLNTSEEVSETIPESIRICLEKYQEDLTKQMKQDELERQKKLAQDSQADQSFCIEPDMIQQINEGEVNRNHGHTSQAKNKKNVNRSVDVTEKMQILTHLSNFQEESSNNQIQPEESAKTSCMNENFNLSLTQVNQAENVTKLNSQAINNKRINTPNSVSISDALKSLASVNEENESSPKSKKSPGKKNEKTKKSSSQKSRKKLWLDAYRNESEIDTSSEVGLAKVPEVSETPEVLKTPEASKKSVASKRLKVLKTPEASKKSVASKRPEASTTPEASETLTQKLSTNVEENIEINISTKERDPEVLSPSISLGSIYNKHTKDKENQNNEAQENIDFNNDVQNSSHTASYQRNEVASIIKEENFEKNNFTEDNGINDIHRCLTPNIINQSNDVITIEDEDEPAPSHKTMIKDEYIKDEIDIHEEFIDTGFLRDMLPDQNYEEPSKIKNINKNLITPKTNLSTKESIKGNNISENPVITIDDDDDDDEVDRASKISSDRETVKMDLSDDDIFIETEKIVLESYTYTNKCIDEEIECINISRTIKENCSTPSPKAMDPDFLTKPVILGIESISSHDFDDINTLTTEVNQANNDILLINDVKIESEDEYFVD